MKRSLLFFGLISGALLLVWFTSQYMTPTSTVSAALADSFNQGPEMVSENIECAVNHNYPEEVRQWCGLITTYSRQHNLEPNLIAALIWQESGGASEIISRDGAVGLMQIMPSDGKAAEFMCINGPCFANRPTTQELFDPEFNIAWGTAFLSSLQKNHGSIRDALKAYGPANAGYSYADKVLGIYNSY